MRTLKLKSGATALAVVGAAISGCMGTGDESDLRQARMSANEEVLVSPVQQPMFHIRLLKDAENPVYTERLSDGTAAGVLQMEAGGTYILVLESGNPNISYQLSVGGGALQPLQAGANVIQAPAQVSNVIYKIIGSVPGAPPRVKSYMMGVTCQESVIQNFAVNSSAIQAQIETDNVYLYSVNMAGVSPSGRDYECAFDFNGDGIRDSDYGECGTTAREYSNHINQREIGLYVRDVVCNKVKIAKRNQDLLATRPEGMNFIAGDLSSVNPDPRLNVQHLSTNPPEFSRAPVQCSFTQSSTNGGVFTVSGLYRYRQGMASSKDHGLSISFKNISGSLDYRTQSGSLDASTAVINNVRFDTDEIPDSASRLSFQGSGCTGNLEIQVRPITGTPCTGGSGETRLGLEVLGIGTNIQCLGLPSSNLVGGSVDLQNGAFYCSSRLMDSCGGGGGGGGVDPISF